MPTVTITRALTSTLSVTKVGNAVQFAISAGVNGNFRWDETTGAAYGALGPRITEQVFCVRWPTIVGTADTLTSLGATLFINGVEVRFNHVGALSYYTPNMHIIDRLGFRTDLPYDPVAQQYVRVVQEPGSPGMTTVSLGPDGATWTEVASGDYAQPDFGGDAQLDTLILTMGLQTYSGGDPPDALVGGFDSWVPALRPFGTTMYDVTVEPDVPDGFDPDAASPAAGPECATLLDLIRTFSGLVKRAVRLTGPTSIAMVDPNEPLPSGWTSADADGFYHATTRKLTAGAEVLSMLAGDLALEVNAAIVSDDVRLVVSDWRIPQRLPVFGLAAAPVKHIEQSFTPYGYTASVEFNVPAVPLSLRRT